MCCKQGVIGNGCDGTFGAKNYHGCALKTSKFLCQFHFLIQCLSITNSLNKKQKNVEPMYYHIETAMCLPWPERPTYGCGGGGEYKVLDWYASDITSCQAKCLQEQKIGCCLFKSGSGCHWWAGGKAAPFRNGDAMATTCYPGKS